MTPLDVAARTPYPKLTLLVGAGAALLALGGLLWVIDPFVDASTGLFGFRVAFVGFLSLVFGASGYVAIKVFETHPGP